MNKNIQIVSSTIEMHEIQKKSPSPILFIPTMGALHQGHISLIQHAQSIQKNGEVWVSIFVNPRQFTNSKDLESYPQAHAADIAILEELQVTGVFIPNAEEFYDPKILPELFCPKPISLPEMFSWAEGEMRPGHFEGVFEVLFRLFSLIQPSYSVFGQKDFQQTLLVKYLQRKYFPSLSIHVQPTARAENGLALSSRNMRIPSSQYHKSNILFTTLEKIQHVFSEGAQNSAVLLAEGMKILEAERLCTEISLEIRRSSSFEKREGTVETGDVILLSLNFCDVHLIDNWILQ